MSLFFTFFASKKRHQLSGYSVKSFKLKINAGFMDFESYKFSLFVRMEGNLIKTLFMYKCSIDKRSKTLIIIRF
jgi:hypothetical protein